MYTEKQLVGFGNYLLGKYGVMVHSNDGKNTPIYQRSVHHADVCNWKHENEAAQGTFDAGDKVTATFGSEALPAEVRGVHVFHGEKTKYDLALMQPEDTRTEKTRVYNVEAGLVAEDIR